MSVSEMEHDREGGHLRRSLATGALVAVGVKLGREAHPPAEGNFRVGPRLSGPAASAQTTTPTLTPDFVAARLAPGKYAATWTGLGATASPPA